jgi:hypothetical protein
MAALVRIGAVVELAEGYLGKVLQADDDWRGRGRGYCRARRSRRRRHHRRRRRHHRRRLHRHTLRLRCPAHGLRVDSELLLLVVVASVRAGRANGRMRVSHSEQRKRQKESPPRDDWHMC